MAAFDRKMRLVSTCVRDKNDMEICLNDVVYSESRDFHGFITRRKGIFYVESLNSLVPLESFEGSKPNFKSQCFDLSVITDYQTLERFIREMFNEIESY